MAGIIIIAPTHFNMWHFGIIVSLVASLAHCALVEQKYFPKTTGKRHSGTIMSTKTVKSISDCTMACADDRAASPTTWLWKRMETRDVNWSLLLWHNNWSLMLQLLSMVSEHYITTRNLYSIVSKNYVHLCLFMSIYVHVCPSMSIYVN